MPKLHVISLRRRNLLRRYVSFQLRPLTGVAWQPDPKPLVLEAPDLIADFEHHTAKTDEFDKLFRGRRLLRLDYEDLCTDFEASMGRVQSFLNVPYRRLYPVTPKLATQRLDQVIQNYEQLKQEFSATRWAEFFDA